MISIETEECRFFTGDNVHYRDAPTPWLHEQVVEAEDEAMRAYAAAGLMRALLDTPIRTRAAAPFLDSVSWARDMILDVQACKELRAPQQNVKDYVEGLPPVNGVFDSVSVTATKANMPRVTAAILNKHIPETEPKFVIALGHGGILSSLATYSALSGNNEFYPIRFSKYKAKDSSPAVADEEVELMRELAQDRAVVIHDEDRGARGDTIRDAINYINSTLEVTAYGVTPVLARHPSEMWPEIIRNFPGFGYRAEICDIWSDEMIAMLKAEQSEQIA